MGNHSHHYHFLWSRLEPLKLVVYIPLVAACMLASSFLVCISVAVWDDTEVGVCTRNIRLNIMIIRFTMIKSSRPYNDIFVAST